MITMRGISRFIAESLDGSAEFIALANTLVGAPFSYYINIDRSFLEDNVPPPYCSVVTFNNQDDKEVRKFFKTTILIGIERSVPVKVGNITEEDSVEIIETLSMKAVELFMKDLRIFGVQGETNIRLSFVNYYVPNPDGEDDLQMQIDIEFDQDKYLTC